MKVNCLLRRQCLLFNSKENTHCKLKQGFTYVFEWEYKDLKLSW